jgi:hypothetical protein
MTTDVRRAKHPPAASGKKHPAAASGKKHPAAASGKSRRELARFWKWAAGVAATVIASVSVAAFSNWFQPDPQAMGGDINFVHLIPTRPCCQFAVNFTLKGFRGQDAHWASAITNTDTDTTTTPADLDWTSRPDANEDQATIEFTVLIEQPGDYYVSFILFDPNKNELDRASSETFKATYRQANAAELSLN